MVTKKELVITIAPDGSILVDVKGVKGKSCVDLVKFLQDSVGDTAQQKFKPDYYERENIIHGEVSTKEQ